MYQEVVPVTQLLCGGRHLGIRFKVSMFAIRRIGLYRESVTVVAIRLKPMALLSHGEVLQFQA